MDFSDIPSVRFPPHFVLVPKGAGILPVGLVFGRGVGQRLCSTLISTRSVREQGWICETLLKLTHMIPELCQEGAEVGEEGLQGKQASASTPRKKCHQIVTARSS